MVEEEEEVVGGSGSSNSRYRYEADVEGGRMGQQVGGCIRRY